MAYVPPKYPSQIPTAEDLPDRADDIDWMYAARYNELKKELRAALIELGVDPAGAYETVVARLDDLGVPTYIELNIMLNAFRIAINGSLVKHNMVDGTMDEFEDESGVDTGASENEDYDAGNDLYGPTPLEATSFSEALGADTGGWLNYSLRQIISAGSLSTSGTKIRVTLEAMSTEGVDIDHVSIVERDGTSDDGTTTPTEILFSAGSGVSIGAGSEETSDWLTYTLDETKDYLLIVDVGSNAAADGFRYNAAGGEGAYYKANTNSYDQQTVSGFTLDAGMTTGINKLEVTGRNNMTLISQATTADAQPDDARIVLFEEDVDAITINTDLKAWVSRDGSTYTQITLTDEGDYQGSKRILTGTADISGQPAGTTMRWKVTTHNGKDLKLHGVGELWN